MEQECDLKVGTKREKMENVIFNLIMCRSAKLLKISSKMTENPPFE